MVLQIVALVGAGLTIFARAGRELHGVLDEVVWRGDLKLTVAAAQVGDVDKLRSLPILGREGDTTCDLDAVLAMLAVDAVVTARAVFHVEMYRCGFLWLGREGQREAVLLAR